ANFGPDDIASPVSASNDADGLSWNVSVSYDFPIGVRPYVTLSEQSTIIAGQGAEITTPNVANDNFFDTSELFEVGIKGSFLDDALYMALSYYEQERTDFNAQAIVTNATNRTEGIEFEARWAATDRLLLTLGYSNIEVVNLTALENGGIFSFFGAEDLPQIDPTLLFGGAVIGVPPATAEAEARRAGVPENILSLTGTYLFDNGLSINASIVDVDEVFSGFSQAVRLPSYTLVNAGFRYETDNWALSVNGKNLTDERYFRANFPNLFGSQIVLPELPRHYQASISFRF
ncbi:MAG: TonB-dependent receptor, partial [Woeseiaceae bacterium]